MTDKEFRNLEVGKTFVYKNKKLIVKEAEINDCTGCFFYEDRRDMINWKDGEEFDYICECCGHKFRLVAVVHHQFKIVKKG